MEEYFLPRREPIANLLRGIVQNTEMKIIAFLMVDSDKNRKYRKIVVVSRQTQIRLQILCVAMDLFKRFFFSSGFHKLLQHAREIGENNEVVESTQAAFNKLFVL